VAASFRYAMKDLKSDPLSANYEAKSAGDGSATCESLGAYMLTLK